MSEVTGFDRCTL